MMLDLLALIFALAGSAAAQNGTDPLKFVNPLIGSLNGGESSYKVAQTDKPGNVFAGATVPYGMAKPVADTSSPSRQGGFVSDNYPVTGFSSMHDSGTGGSPSLGNFALFPYASCPGDDINQCNFPKKSRAVPYDNTSVIATPGYFSIRIAGNTTVDMTATHHASLFRFNFPSAAAVGSPLILMDLTDLSDSRHDNGTISVDPVTGRMVGGARFIPSFGQGSYYVNFCADFKGSSIRDSGIFVDSRASASVSNLTISRGINGYPLPGGGFVRFNPSSGGQILARVGLSFISTDQACSNAESEIPDFGFDAVKQAAEAAWRIKLSNVAIDAAGADPSLITMFYRYV
jgi:putative alpha-1,2-mannosidase